MFKCDKCGYTDKMFFGLCRSCGDGIGVEVQNAVPIKGAIGKNVEIKQYKIEKADGNVDLDEIVKITKFNDFNKVLSSKGGFVKDQVIAIGAQPGVGKSTICAQICTEDSLYISTEESLNQVKSRFNRVNPDSGASVVAETDLETIIHIIGTTNCKFIIIDSLNSINNGAEGYVRQAGNLSRITSVLKASGKVGIIINQVTKSGGITGMNTILHTVDTVMYLDKSEVSDFVILGSSKNRFGAIGSVAIFEHNENGLKEISGTGIEDIGDSTGVTITKAKFGYKTMDVVVEALVAPSSANFGLRRTYGLNVARVQQIIGVLSSNSKIDFSNKDIYVSISNGLNVDDTSIDLAIANSILSSYYQQKSLYKELTGSISLNGSVRKSKMIPHIKDLIRSYKKG